MQPDLPLKSAQKPKGISLATMFVLFVVALLLLAGGIFWFYRQQGSENERLRMEKADMERRILEAENDKKRAEESAKLAAAGNLQQQALFVARTATNSLMRLLAERSAVGTSIANLLTNEPGKNLSPFPDLVIAARQLVETDLPAAPSEGEIVTRLEAARRIEVELVEKAGTQFAPEESLIAPVKASTEWAETAMKQVSQLQSATAGLARETKVKVLSSAEAARIVTLREAIDLLKEGEAQARQRQLVEARKDADLIAAKAEAQKIIDEAKLKAADIERQAQEARDAAAREQVKRDAEQRLADTQAKLAAGATDNQARSLELKRKASDPEIQAKLTPFTTPGTFLLNGSRSADKKPISYSGLLNGGSLEPTVKGMQKLVVVATVSMDRDQPRWKFERSDNRSWQKHPAEVERVREAQQLLIELGPTMVEMGLLAP